MSARTDNFDDAGAGGWSLLYAPDSSLHPIACVGCGNVFAADAPTCPWCGRSVTAPPRHAASAIAVGEVGARSPGTDTSQDDASHDGTATDPDRDASPDRDGERSNVEHADGAARRWAGVLVAGGVLVAIATGVAVRGRDTTPSGAAAAPATKATTIAPPRTTVAAVAATTAAAPTSAATSAPATTSATEVATPTSAAAGPTTAPARTTVAAPSTTLSPVVALLNDRERRALAVTQRLTDAIVGHEWSRVRALAPNNATTDDAYDRYWGTIESAVLVPARVVANADETYAVYTGVLNVTNPRTGRVSLLACARYTVDLRTEVVSAVRSKDLRTTTGVVDPSTVATELRTTCNDPTF